MSVEFSNAYQEILLDNLISVIKQNFVFQTQLKLVDKTGKEKEELQKKFEEINSLYNSTKNEVNQLQTYKVKAEQNSSAHEEKNRIQAALNDSMKKNSSLQKEIDSIKIEKNKELEELKEELNNLKAYITKLEENISITKLKKINPEKVAAENEIKVIENNLQKVLDGSSF
jgi:predicted  nucleic acid-binding Zn-ribbon protein